MHKLIPPGHPQTGSCIRSIASPCWSVTVNSYLFYFIFVKWEEMVKQREINFLLSSMLRTLVNEQMPVTASYQILYAVITVC